MEYVILIFSLALFCASIVMTLTGDRRTDGVKQPLANAGKPQSRYLKKKDPGPQPLGVINICDLKDDVPVGIIVYRMSQAAEMGIYNRRGEFLKRKNPPLY
jgi:hypothetical protein